MEENMKVKLCSICKGLGRIYDLRGAQIKCSECGGTGRMIRETHTKEYTIAKVTDDTFLFDSATMKVKICPKCKGLGVISHKLTKTVCADCGGSGRYVEEKIETDGPFLDIDREE